MNDAAGAANVLEVEDLTVRFASEDGDIVALDGISFDIPQGSTMALVGESGSGKSVTAHAIMRLLPSPPAEVTSGHIRLRGRELLELPERQMRRVRGAQIAIVFQDPTSALNPVYSIGSQVVEAVRIHQRDAAAALGHVVDLLLWPLRSLGWLRGSPSRRRALELLGRVGFPQPEERFDDYPHELSGGMRQRVMLAIATSCSPVLLIADEPTTALDMLAAAQINALMADLKRHHDLSLLLISHDLAVVAEFADHIVVLYAGQVMERGPAHQVLSQPAHPYTRGLLASIPPLRKRRRRRRATPTRLPTISGTVPDPRARPHGCRFADRCAEAFERCRAEVPPLYPLGAVAARCFLHAPTDETATEGGAP